MEPIRDPDAYRRCVGAVRRNTSAFTSNLYATGEQVQRWCAGDRLRALECERAVLLLRADRDFDHVYHVAEDQQALAAALARLPTGTYVVDLIGQGAALDEVCTTYTTAGFADHRFLRRMVRIESGPIASQGDVTVATSDDASEIAAFLNRLLDRLAEQIPEVGELEREAREGRLLIVRKAGAVAGMLMYDLKGQSGQLRFWHVDQHRRGEGIGRELMAAFLARCAGAQRLLLWVIGDNDRSIAIYRHYGFAPDGLIDRVMTLNKEQL